ncbi:hypothetical protein BOX37_26610 [Nocardia mangyaensis]|uniref:Outer membrane channel protein CpnT-like N-terminal domain-containing protein n=1 Tax=Nocardia mangyaensis TaxID=2213200 RepID=A0A1J0VY49_9NOCA|nr:hypothetical protein [Nocardia mangyaensis]APE36914.1 hypothetical protein BOX37_26610 [Nocardia mangyaensis]
MAIQIPSEVALFLNFLGFPYPDINEDHVRELADQVRVFAEKVQNTHTEATGVINDMGSVYSGYSYEQLVTVWAHMSATNMADLDQACTVVATALDAAAIVIVSVKVAVLTELAALAVAYATAMSAAVATSGLSAAMGPAITAAARRLLVAMEQTLLSYLLAEVIVRAVEPLEDTVARVVNGFAYESTRRALGVPLAPEHAPTLHIDPDEVLRYTRVLDDHASDITQHAEDFANSIADLDFTTTDSGSNDGAGVPRSWATPSLDQPTGSLPPNPGTEPRYDDGPAITAPPTTMGSPTTQQAVNGKTELAGTPPPVSAAPASASESPAQNPSESTPDSTGRTQQPTEASQQPTGTPDQRHTGAPGGQHLDTPDHRISADGGGNTAGPARAVPALSDPVGAEVRSDREQDVRTTASMPTAPASDPAAPRGLGSSSGTTISTGSPLSTSASADNQTTSSAIGNPAPAAGGSTQPSPRGTPWTRAAKPAGSSTTPPKPGSVDATAAQSPRSPSERPPITTPWSKTRPTTVTPARISAPESTRPAPNVALPPNVPGAEKTGPGTPTPSSAAPAPPVAADQQAAAPNRDDAPAGPPTVTAPEHSTPKST